MVTVNLVNGYFVEIDDMNHTLKQHFAGKDKNEKKKLSVRLIGYFPSTVSCIEQITKLMRLEKMESMTLSLGEYIEQIKQSDEEMKLFIEKFANEGGFSETKKVFRIEE